MHLSSRLNVSLTFACLFVVVSGCGAEFSSLDELLLKSARLIGPVPSDHGLEYEEVAFPTEDGSQLVGWFVPALSGAGRATAVIHTGMQGNMELYLLTLPWWAENDFNAFVYDWRGFGNSEGLRRFGHFEADTIAALEYLKTRPEPGTDLVIQAGVSLGAAPALAAAARYPDETIGVIVFGAYEPARLPTDFLVTQLTPLLVPFGEISGSFFGAWSTPFLAPSSHLDGVHAPILAVIAEDDITVPPETQRALFERYPEPKEILYTFGGHQHSQEEDPNLGPGVIAWCERLDGLPAAQ